MPPIRCVPRPRRRADGGLVLKPISSPQAAVDMMRKVLNSISMDGIVVIGEGEKDEVRARRRAELEAKPRAGR